MSAREGRAESESERAANGLARFFKLGLEYFIVLVVSKMWLEGYRKLKNV